MARMDQTWDGILEQDELKSPCILVVDMVNGFVKEGALADKEIGAAAGPIRTLLDTTQAPSVFLCDSHSPRSREFAAYPPHCLKDTEEEAIMQELQPYAKTVCPKNSTNGFFSPAFQEWFVHEGQNFDDYIVTGCCTDLCVLQLALSLQAWLNQHDLHNKRVIVPADCVDTYDMDGIHPASFWNRTSLQNMEANGIKVVQKIRGNE